MTSEERWSMFCYELIETGWFDYDRVKTLHAMRQIFERVPQEVLYELPSIIVFAPSSIIMGEIKPWYQRPLPTEIEGAFMYLAPELETKS